MKIIKIIFPIYFRKYTPLDHLKLFTVFLYNFYWSMKSNHKNGKIKK